MRAWIAVLLLLVPAAGAETATFYLHEEAFPVWSMDDRPEAPPIDDERPGTAWRCQSNGLESRLEVVGDLTLLPGSLSHGQLRFGADGDIGFGHPFDLTSPLRFRLPLVVDDAIARSMDIDVTVFAGGENFASYDVTGSGHLQEPYEVLAATDLAVTLAPGASQGPVTEHDVEGERVYEVEAELVAQRQRIAYDENWVIVVGIDQARPCQLSGVDFHASEGMWPRFSFDLNGGHGVMESRMHNTHVSGETMSWAGTAWLGHVDARIEGPGDLGEVQVSAPWNDAYHHTVAGFHIQVALPDRARDGEYTVVATITADGKLTEVPLAWLTYSDGELATTCTIHGGNRACYDKVEENVPWPLALVILALVALARRFS